MEYIKVKWLHVDPEYPILLLSELDGNRFEVRKVEVFLDGHACFASEMTSNGTALGEMEIPQLAEIAADPQFIVQDISSVEFEKIWAAATVGKKFQFVAGDLEI